MTVVVVLGGLYALLYAATRRYLTSIGVDRREANRERYHISSEAFSGIKEVKLKDLGDAYADRFNPPSERFATTQASSQTLSQIPRFALEVIAFGGILLVVLYLLAVKQGLSNALPLIALYAFAGYRMLPTLQEIYASISKVRFGQPALESLHEDMMRRAGSRERGPLGCLCSLLAIHPARESDLSLSCPERPVLTELSLEIPRGARVGFVGPTGSGKSTVIDLILGLLRPVSGSRRRRRSGTRHSGADAWMATPNRLCPAAHLPRRRYDSREHCFWSARGDRHQGCRARSPHGAVARFHRSGASTRAMKPASASAEFACRGGQRQRLGLARALYQDPAVLVLDEATSALDNKTEDAVMKAIDGLSSDCTIIMIAHRLSTVRRCDVLFELEKGAIAATGSYADVVGVSERISQ